MLLNNIKQVAVYPFRKQLDVLKRHASGDTIGSIVAMHAVCLRRQDNHMLEVSVLLKPLGLQLKDFVWRDADDGHAEKYTPDCDAMKGAIWPSISK